MPRIEIWTAKVDVSYFEVDSVGKFRKTSLICSQGYKFAGVLLQPPLDAWIKTKVDGKVLFLPVFTEVPARACLADQGETSASASEANELIQFVCTSNAVRTNADTNAFTDERLSKQHLSGGATTMLLEFLRKQEGSFVAEMDAWKRHDIQMQQVRPDPMIPGDKFEARATNMSQASVRKAQRAKSLTNKSVADAVAQSLNTADSRSRTSWYLILDGAEGNTTKALMRVGVPPSQILSPNVVPATAAVLRFAESPNLLLYW